jgi:hypothetical protein
MIPVVGEVTAVRDIIAVTIGLSLDDSKRRDKLEWLTLTLLLFALIPVVGGSTPLRPARGLTFPSPLLNGNRPKRVNPFLHSSSPSPGGEEAGGEVLDIKEISGPQFSFFLLLC